MKILSIEMGETKNGAPFKKCTLDTEIHGKDRFNIFSFHPRYSDCVEGLEIAPDDIIQDGQYISLIDPDKGISKPSGGSRASTKTENLKAEHIKEAQGRKDNSIAYHGSIKNAIEYLSSQNQPFTIEDVYEIQKQFLKHWEQYNDPQKEPPF